eukprot:COSAG02_NODE_202_length_29305_cov_20.432377_12_plen_71_part_00
MYISMSYHYSKYEFLGPESDLETREVQFQVIEFFEPPVGVQHTNPAHMHDQYVVQYANSPYELYAEFGIN